MTGSIDGPVECGGKGAWRGDYRIVCLPSQAGTLIGIYEFRKKQNPDFHCRFPLPIFIADSLEGEESAHRKHEYVFGEVSAMVGGNVAHNRIAANVQGELFSQLKANPCEVFGFDTKIKISSRQGVRFSTQTFQWFAELRSPTKRTRIWLSLCLAAMNLRRLFAAKLITGIHHVAIVRGLPLVGMIRAAGSEAAREYRKGQ